MFKSIVLATDGSAHAKRAAAAAADLAATYGARLTIVTVMPNALTLEDVESSPQAARLPRSAKAEIRRLRTLARESQGDADIYPYVPALHSLGTALADAILDDAESVTARKKISKVTRLGVIGDPAAQILAQAKKAKADLIVMGTRGLSDFRGLMLGSVSHKIIHMSACPCLTVK